MVALIKRLNKGVPLTYEEMDGNLDSIDQELSTKVSAASSSMAIINAIQNLRDGVDDAGDTLLKLYNLIIDLENNKINIVDVVNNVTQTDINKPLSAYQGKLLRDALTKEINDRLASSTGDIASVNSSISNEITNRTNADNVLSVRINNILNNTDAVALNSLSELVAAFQSADSNLTTALNTLSSNSTTALNTEISNRTTADATEVTNRNNAITTAINTEVANRNTAIAAAITALEARLYSF
jgi:hypothetical protein